MAVMSEKLPVLENVHPISTEETLHFQTPEMFTVESDWGGLSRYRLFSQTQRQEEVPRDSVDKSSWEKVLVILIPGVRLVYEGLFTLWGTYWGLGFHCVAILSNHILPYEFLPGTSW